MILPAYAATLLVIDPDQSLQADFRAIFAVNGHRTIPAASITPLLAAARDALAGVAVSA